MKKLIDKYKFWTLYYRQEIVWFCLGSITTTLLIILLSILL